MNNSKLIASIICSLLISVGYINALSRDEFASSSSSEWNNQNNKEVVSYTTINIVNQNNVVITKPFLDGDHIVNATLGKKIAMRCSVHNLKNYKVRFSFIFVCFFIF